MMSNTGVGGRGTVLIQVSVFLCQPAQRFKSCRSLCRSGFVSSFDALTLCVQLEVYVVVFFFIVVCA